MIDNTLLKQVNKRAKKAHKKCMRKVKKALRAKDVLSLRMSLTMAQFAFRKIEVSLAFNASGEFCPSKLKRN